eukprot:tig00021135_g18959.t1
MNGGTRAESSAEAVQQAVDIPRRAVDVAALRKDYRFGGLTEVDPNPFKQFELWLKMAVEAQCPEPNAMTIATCTPEGRPSARMVLLKGFDERGFILFTNYGSRKGGELDSNPFASLVFWWAELERQVRIEGRVERVSPAESDEYFYSRPVSSQLGAIVSEQSRPIAAREALEARLKQLEEEYRETGPRRPEHWGGYRVVPDAIEFWQGRPSRLHDRIKFTKQADGSWRTERLQP